MLDLQLLKLDVQNYFYTVVLNAAKIHWDFLQAAAIQEKNDPHAMASIFFKLYYADLFTQRNFDSVLAHPHLVGASHLLRGFNRQNSLTQTMFEQLICSKQEKISLSDVPNELKKFTVLSKHSNLSIYPCGASFFPANKRRQDQESPSKTIEFNRQICKN